jgi:hypothetical protein
MPVLSPTVRLGDIGTIFQATLVDADDGSAIDVSLATTQEFIYKKPDDTKVTKTTVFASGGTDGVIRYVTVLDDLDLIGVWQLQAHIITPSGEWHSETDEFRVAANL